MAEEKSEFVEVKFIRPANYKGVEFKLGSTAKLLPHVAERMIAAGNAELAKAEKKAEK